MSIGDWLAFDRDNSLGDAGRQAEVRAKAGPLTVGVADSALDFFSLDTLEIRACSSRGWSHRDRGIPRQDSYCLLADEELVVVAVADGVSESDYSQVAAETAARAACKLVVDHFARSGDVDWLNLSRRVSMRIVDEAEYRQLVPAPHAEATLEDRLKVTREAMATTLIVAWVRRQPTHRGFPAGVAVIAGDSVAYALRGGALEPAGGGKDDSGPIASGSVRPLPGAVEPTYAELILQPGEALLVGTDGIGDIIGDGEASGGRELASRWATPPTIDSFLRDVNAYRRTFDDDRTAVGIWLRPDVELPEALPEPEEGQDEPTEDQSPTPDLMSSDPASVGPDLPVVAVADPSDPTDSTECGDAAEPGPTTAVVAAGSMAAESALPDPTRPVGDTQETATPTTPPRQAGGLQGGFFWSNFGKVSEQ